MAPDRPDSSNMETAVSKVYNLDEIQHTKDCTIADDASVVADKTNGELAVKGNDQMKKNSQQLDDELTSLSWLHQQNLLKGLDISDPSKDIRDEIVLSNISDETVEFNTSATNSTSSIDDDCSLEGMDKVMNGSTHVRNGRHLQAKIESLKKNLIMQNNQTKISLNNINNNNNNNNSLPYLNRNKHPTHIPYDPHLHRSSKPPYSFSCLIFMAIEDSPMKALPVKEVYAWILEHFPYFRNAPTGWKNSVRHNLSLNKCFRKVEKAPNLGKGSLWMVDAQYRPNLIQALSRAPFPPSTAQNISSPDKVQKKNVNNRLPDPVLFPYLSKRLASSNICDSINTEFDSDVDAAAAAMLSFKHGPIILNHNKDRKKKIQAPEQLVPIITRSSSEDHTYSCITSVKLESKREGSLSNASQDFDEQRKIAEGADALLNLAGVTTTHNHHSQIQSNAQEVAETPKGRKRPQSNDRLSSLDKRRRRWRDWGENTRYLKQVRG